MEFICLYVDVFPWLHGNNTLKFPWFHRKKKGKKPNAVAGATETDTAPPLPVTASVIERAKHLKGSAVLTVREHEVDVRFFHPAPPDISVKILDPYRVKWILDKFEVNQMSVCSLLLYDNPPALANMPKRVRDLLQTDLDKPDGLAAYKVFYSFIHLILCYACTGYSIFMTYA